MLLGSTRRCIKQNERSANGVKPDWRSIMRSTWITVSIKDKLLILAAKQSYYRICPKTRRR
jgi:hypothetical protein